MTPPSGSSLLNSSPGSAHVYRGSTSSECCFWGRIDKFVQVSRPCSVVVQGKLWCCGARGSRRLAPRRAALWFWLLFLKHRCMSSAPAAHIELSRIMVPPPPASFLVQCTLAHGLLAVLGTMSLCVLSVHGEVPVALYTKPPSHRSGGRGTREVPGGTSTP